MSPPRWVDEHGQPCPTRPCPTCKGVIPIKRWRFLRTGAIRHRPYEALSVVEWCGHLQELILVPDGAEWFTGHVNEADIFCNESGQRLDILPVPRFIPTRLYFPHGVLLIGLGCREGADRKRRRGDLLRTLPGAGGTRLGVGMGSA